MAGVAARGGHAGDGVMHAGLPGTAGAAPRCGGPRGWRSGQEAFQRLAGGRFPAVAAACVEVLGEPGQDVEAGHPGGRGDGPDDGGVPGGVPVAEPPAFFLVTTGPRIWRSAALLSSDIIG